MKPWQKLLIVGCLFMSMTMAAVFHWLRKRPAEMILPRDLPDEEREEKRRIPFARARNTRDLGGYKTGDDRSVKWGVLYRSGDLSKLTKWDVGNLQELGLVKLIDLRANKERIEAPHRLPRPCTIEVVNLPISDANFGDNGKLREIFVSGDISAINPDELLTTTYEGFVSKHSGVYRRFFTELLAAEGKPVLFNCTAGKDRTGFASALLLRTLGVPENVVMADYLLTKDYAAQERRREITMVRLAKGKEAAEVIRRLFGVRAEYLEATWATIEEEYGSFTNFTAQGLGLDAQDIEQLREYYLE